MSAFTARQRDEFAAGIDRMLADDAPLVAFTGQIHPLADAWPMLGEQEIADLADDIAANGLTDPITLDANGALIDGRNRLAACQIAGVTPVFESVALATDAEVAAFVSSRNAERRHLSSGQQAAGRALMLIAQGKRKDGRWARGSVSGESATNADQHDMKRCGLIADWTDLLPDVLAGTKALAAAYGTACEARDDARRQELLAEQHAEQLTTLRESDDHHDLAALVDKGELSIDDAWAAYLKRTEEERAEKEAKAEALAKLSRDVCVAVNTIAALTCSDERKASAAQINPREIPAAAITAERIAEARESLDYLAATLKEKL